MTIQTMNLASLDDDSVEFSDSVTPEYAVIYSHYEEQGDKENLCRIIEEFKRNEKFPSQKDSIHLTYGKTTVGFFNWVARYK